MRDDEKLSSPDSSLVSTDRIARDKMTVREVHITVCGHKMPHRKWIAGPNRLH